MSLHFEQGQFNAHRVIYHSRTEGKYAALDHHNDIIPAGYTRLKLQDLISGLSELTPSINQNDKKALYESLGYMRQRNIQKTNASCLPICITLFFVRLINLFRGYGFQTATARIDILRITLNASPTENAPPEMSKQDIYAYRREIYQETLKACNEGYLVDGNHITIDHAAMLAETERYETAPLLEPLPHEKRFPTLFSILEDDTLNVLLAHARQGRNPIGINMANRYRHGGGVEEGCPAQEEAICRRSNHILGLKKFENEYPLSEFGGIYSPHNSVFREDQAHDFAFMKTPEQVALVAIAAYDLREKSAERTALGITEISEESLAKNIAFCEGTAQKIRNALRIMAQKGHEFLVLGALGCGAFANPPYLIAKLFQQVLSEEEFKGRFRQVDFAILVQYEKDKVNVDAFKKYFVA